jgi:release factor glutamine methyltransferase
LKELPNGEATLLDIGTGSGAIALACKHARPDLVVEAVDISPQALAIAHANGERLGLAVHWREADLLAGAQTGYHAIVANLPYIGEKERHLCDPELEFEPSLALYAGSDGLDVIRRLLRDVRVALHPHGLLWLEHGFQQAEAVRKLAEEHGFQVTSLRDGAGHERFARIALA